MTYVGRRLNADESVAHTFIYQRKNYQWSSLRGLVIGGRYWATYSEDGLRKQFPRRPERIDFLKEIPQEWYDMDTAAETFLKERRESARAKNLITKKDWALIEPLYLRAKKLNINERFAFAEYVRRMIFQGFKK